MALKVLYPNGQVEAVLTFIETSPGVYEPWDGSVTVSVTSSGSAIEDGVNDAIKASVTDYITGGGALNPLSVILTNTDGSPYVASGGGGGGAVTIADGADVTQGAIADAAVLGDNDGSVSAKLRGLNEVLNDVWDSVNHVIDVSAGALPLPTGAATEATLSALNGKVTACNTGAVVVSSSALPIGASTEATLSSLNGKVTKCDTDNVAITTALPAGTNEIGAVKVTPNDIQTYHENSSSALTDTVVASAPGANKRIVVTNIRCSTGAATAWNIFFEEGSTTIIGPIYLEAVAGRGYCSGPIFRPVSTNTALTVTTSAAIAHSIDIEYFIQDV
jgi:hypothetical protein